jgi:hypothetical protein
MQYVSRLNERLTFRGEVFYQGLTNILIDKVSGYSAYNYLDEDLPVNLEPDGNASNIGVDVTLEKIFAQNNYFILGGSYFDSKYDLGGREDFESRFNGNYTFSFTAGRDWVNSAKKRIINLNWRLLSFGGLQEVPINFTASQMSVETVYDYSKGYTKKVPADQTSLTSPSPLAKIHVSRIVSPSRPTRSTASPSSATRSAHAPTSIRPAPRPAAWAPPRTDSS